MSRRERDMSERTGQGVTEQAVKADDLVDEAIATGLGRSDMLVVRAKMLRLDPRRVTVRSSSESRRSRIRP